jgi:hypothetical protein
MAILTPAAINISIQPSVVELQRLNIPSLRYFTRFETGETKIDWDLNIGGAGSVGEAVTASVTSFSDDTVDRLSLPIASFRLRSSFQVSEVAFTAAQTAAQNGSPDELANLMTLSSAGAQREILRAIGSKIFTGVGNAADGGLIGLQAQTVAEAVGSGTNPKKTTSTTSYGGIAPTTAGYEKWTNLIYSNFTTLTRAKLRAFESDLLQGATTGVPGTYTHIFMSPTTAGLWLTAFDGAATQFVNVRQDADLGTGNLMYNGYPVIQDPNVPVGEIYFVDMSLVRLYSFNQSMAPGFSEGRPAEGLNMYVKSLPSDNPQMLKFAQFCMVQLQVKERRGLSILKGVA